MSTDLHTRPPVQRTARYAAVRGGPSLGRVLGIFFTCFSVAGGAAAFLLYAV